MLLNASAILIFFTFLIITINFKNKKKQKKKFVFIILIKFFILLTIMKENFLLLLFQYFPLLDLNSNLIFAVNDLQKLGFLMYYFFFF
jgi:hypothetical protein